MEIPDQVWSSVGTYRPGAEARFVTAAGRYAYLVTSNSSLHVVDLTDPTRPVELGAARVEGLSLITPEMAGTNDPGLLGLLNLEVWGAPISHPPADLTFAFEPG